MNNIEIMNMPLKDKTKSVKNILKFLAYLDERIKTNDRTTEIPIPQKVFIKYFNVDQYNKYKEILIKLEILAQVKHKDGKWYSKDLKICKNYQVFNKYLNCEDFVLVVFDNLKSGHEIKVINEVNGIPKKFVDTIASIKINIADALQAEIEEYHSQRINLHQLKRRISRIFASSSERKISKGKKVARIYTSLSNISKVTRKHFNIKFYEMDIINCQPTLLIAHLADHKKQVDIDYKNDCENGTFYEKFIDIFLIEEAPMVDATLVEIARVETKKAIYKNVFFGFNRKNKVNLKFKKLYPEVWESLNDIAISKVSLACILQNIEAELFNSLLPQKSDYYYTLFDAICYSNDRDTLELENKITSFFLNKNIKAKIKKN
ncbi:hypothetical protein HNP99_001624 [Flavobacterium sp. 28A]|uniref:hypothetical protein n=1 Tax=Flavobacterium sp. 28A TaxID=2735895 RepID=UPI0015705D73|nr:hypothetical protein [Flavobacterium sp. 28A]NRT15277.1 hypothetical protein [Flavobacterium sp. 28A]